MVAFPWGFAAGELFAVQHDQGVPRLLREDGLRCQAPLVVRARPPAENLGR
jgi:hypothetical protein